MSDQLYRKNEKGKYVKLGPADYEHFRRMAPGVWIVEDKPGCHSRECVAKLCDLPEHPYDFASIMAVKSQLMGHMQAYRKRYAEKHNGWCPSHSDEMNELLLYLAKISGNRGKAKNTKVRRIDLTL